MVNEDRVAFFEHPDRFKLALLADGMGGHNAGDVASEMTIEETKKFFLNMDVAQLDSLEAKKQWMLQTIQSVNEAIYKHSLSHDSCKGMGTTLILVLIDGDECLIGHIGDSRVYHFTQEGVSLITKDHSYVNFLVEYGEISEEEAANHPQKNFIVKSLGTESTIEPDFYELQLESTSYVLICSDGLSNKLSTEDMSAILNSPLSLDEKAKKMVKQANDSGGEDNISVILISNNEEV